MILYPKLYYTSVKEISLEILNKNNIKGIILDIDNTLIDFDRNMPDGIMEWIQSLKDDGLRLIILSNTNKKYKVKKVSEDLQIEYIMFAKKPLKSGFKKAKERLGLNEENIAVIGDQIFTDVIGANRCKMFPILVKPIGKKDHIITRIKRPLEGLVVKMFLKKERNKKCI